MNPVEVLEVYERYGMIERGHFLLSSGRHSDTYLEKGRILAHPRITHSLAEPLAARFGERVDTVASPAVGAIPLGFAVAYHRGCRFLFAERVEGALTFRRGQTIGRGERVLVVEDIITTGGSAAELIRLCEQAGGHTLGVAALADRSERPPPFRLEALARITAPSWDPAECPLCSNGNAPRAPGSRHLT